MRYYFIMFHDNNRVKGNPMYMYAYAERERERERALSTPKFTVRPFGYTIK